MTTTSTATITLTAQGSQFDAGTATITRPENAENGVKVFVVVPDQRAAEHFGVHARAGQLVGGIVWHAKRRCWSPIAYTDRRHVFDGTGPVYDLPYARNRAAAIRALLRWWNVVDVGRVPADRQPWELSRDNQRYLVA